MADRLTNIIQQYVAITSVGASTVRGSPKGTVDSSREFFCRLSLRKFGVKSELVFRRCLDETTEQMKKALPKGRRDWALARKLLNIFLHNAFYNHYLREQYNLEWAERFFEVPVDSAVARGVRRKFPRGTFSPWPGLKRLKKKEHDEYQNHAELIAAQLGLARVHLDAVLWVQER